MAAKRKTKAQIPETKKPKYTEGWVILSPRARILRILSVGIVLGWM